MLLATNPDSPPLTYDTTHFISGPHALQSNYCQDLGPLLVHDVANLKRKQYFTRAATRQPKDPEPQQMNKDKMNNLRPAALILLGESMAESVFLYNRNPRIISRFLNLMTDLC